MDKQMNILQNKTTKSAYKCIYGMLERGMVTLDERRVMQEIVAFIYGSDFKAEEIVEIVDLTIQSYKRSNPVK